MGLTVPRKEEIGSGLRSRNLEVSTKRAIKMLKETGKGTIRAEEVTKENDKSKEDKVTTIESTSIVLTKDKLV